MSDYHLAVLNLAEITLELHPSKTMSSPHLANEFCSVEHLLKLIAPPFDQLVLLALHYIQERSGLSIHLISISSMDIYETSCPHFLERYRIWKFKSQSMDHSQSSHLTLLEKKLVIELSKNPRLNSYLDIIILMLQSQKKLDKT